MQVLDRGFVRLVDSMPAMPSVVDFVWGAGDARIVEAARLSIGGQRPVSDDKKLLRYLFANKHTSPFEKVRFEFDVKLPIFVARQWIRHRMGSFNELSARYSELPAEFYAPSVERLMSGAQATTNKQGSVAGLTRDTAQEMHASMQMHNARSYLLYGTLLADGLARELARTVLPVGIYTRWYWTVDLHNLMHFLRLRLDPHAQWEIGEYGRAIVELIRPLVPYTLSLFEESRG